jgi:hypothetical protein
MPGEDPSGAAAMGAAFAALAATLALSDEEALRIFDLDALSAISGDLAHRPELAILESLTSEAEERVGEAVLRRWLRTSGPRGRPLDMLLEREFAAFEDALADLIDRGLILRGGSGR